MANISKVNHDGSGYGVTYETSEKKLTRPESDFMAEVDQLLLRVSSSFRDKNERIVLIDEIVRGVNARLAQAQFDKSQVLQAAQLPVLNAAREMRTKYLHSIWLYARYPLFIGVILSVLWIMCLINLQKIYSILLPLDPLLVDALVNGVGAIGFSLCGLVIGATLSIFVTNRNFSIDNFDRIQRYGLPASTYFYYLYILTTVVILLLWFKILILGFGSVSLNRVSTEPYFGLIIGLLCGMSDTVLADLVIGTTKPTKHP